MTNPNVRFCTREGCYDPAVGGNVTASNDHCRPHLLEEVKGELVRCEVTGTVPICGLDGRGVALGGVVDLHPGETDIPALVYSGLVNVQQPPKAKAADTKTA